MKGILYYEQYDKDIDLNKTDNINIAYNLEVKLIDLFEYKFFRLPVDEAKLNRFIETKINGIKVKKISKEAILNILKDETFKEEIKEIKDAYKKVRNINDTSLCMSLSKLKSEIKVNISKRGKEDIIKSNFNNYYSVIKKY